jgi:hypothetical protein
MIAILRERNEMIQGNCSKQYLVVAFVPEGHPIIAQQFSAGDANTLNKRR